MIETQCSGTGSLPHPFTVIVVRRHSTTLDNALSRPCRRGTGTLGYRGNYASVTQGGPLNPTIRWPNPVQVCKKPAANDKLKGRENTTGRSVKNERGTGEGDILSPAKGGKRRRDEKGGGLCGKVRLSPGDRNTDTSGERGRKKKEARRNRDREMRRVRRKRGKEWKRVETRVEKGKGRG